jgi:chlorite dismutase
MTATLSTESPDYKMNQSHLNQRKTQTIEEMREGRQFLRYTFFKLLPSWRALENASQERAKHELKLTIDRFSKRMIVKTFSLFGTRGDTDFMIWSITERLEDFQDLTSGVLKSTMGKHLVIPYSYLSMTRRSEYIRDHKHPGQEGDSLKKIPGDAKYLFVYPFVKKREWYSLPMEERQRMMMEHVRVGHKYPSVKINTSYSFGLDDQEFVLSFESDYPSDFLELVMDLRSSEVSKYTALETPLFTCVSSPVEELLCLL